MQDDCIFCKIAQREVPCYKIWENATHLAFLTPYPNTPGFTVVIPKEHHGSYVFDVPEDAMIGVVRAAKEVAKLLDTRLEDVGRTGMIFEGFGVDHLHAKLFPMHGTKMNEWKAIKSNVDKFFENYEGYISSHDYRRADDAWLEEIAKKILRED